MSFLGPTDDRLAIHELVMTYGDAVSRNNPDEWGETWAIDATWSVANIPGMELIVGRQAIVDKWIEAMADYKQIVNTATVGALTIDGNRGHGRTYTNELGTDLQDNKMRVAGRYDDEFIKQDGRWYFASRVFNILHVD